MRLILFIFTALFSSCTTAQESESKFLVKGINFEAPKTHVTASTFKPIQELGSNWISLMPYAFTRNGEPDIKFNEDWQWVGEREEGIVESIESARANNLKVMIKPHLWIHSQFTGDVKFETEEKWKRWEDSYSNYILFYAKLSEKHNVEMLCIGTELKEFIKERPLYWSNLIEKVKKVYSGKITYAANWDNYDKIPFWKELDLIGIDAYFPLNEEKTPIKKELIIVWEKWWNNLEIHSETVNKKIIFTEIGYRSIDYCAKEPWVSYDDLGKENQQAQANCLEAFFETAKNKAFFEGVFLWKWHCDEHLPQKGNKMYTFQNKKSEEIVRKTFK